MSIARNASTASAAATHGSSTATHEGTERRQAARALLNTPILHALDHPDQLALVRRHSAYLRQLFFSRVGYTLIVETGFARLQKDPLDRSTVVRPALRTSGQPFTARTYTYLALLSSALLSTDVADQVLLSTLVEQVRADAVTAGLTLDDTTEQARHLVQALHLLIGWGVVAETDGTVAGWGARHEEALLDVNRALLPHLLSGSLRDLTGPEQLLTRTDDVLTGEAPRRSLRRKLIENPLVRREDLTDAERDVLSRERTDLARRLDEDFGLILEVRAEGALAYDVDDDITDVAFPGRGTVPHAALLLTNALIDVLRPTAETRAEVDGVAVPGVLASWPTVRENVELIIEQYGASFGDAYRSNAETLTNAVVELLSSLSLARPVAEGLVLHPACARYRPEPQRAPATRAARRMNAAPNPTTTTEQLSLLPTEETP